MGTKTVRWGECSRTNLIKPEVFPYFGKSTL
jgi:hypothetical protein